MVEVLVRVEETFGIAVPDSELMADTFATPPRCGAWCPPCGNSPSARPDPERPEKETP
ncbi:hypothetical protein [Streptomyces scabiei]|uniref:hypothetical protein n=1 Tax=Streptomyces scabiei TaxID=1930 RepID=UPI002FF3AA62